MLAAAVGLGAAAGRGDVRPDGLARVDAILEEQQKKEHIPGLAFVAVQDDRVVVLRTLGQRDRERKLPVTADTLFPIGSCTKTWCQFLIAHSP